MKLAKKEKIGLIVTLYIILTFLFYQYLYSPLAQQVDKMEAENEFLGNQKAILQRMNQDKKKRQIEIEKLLVENRKMEQKIPADKEIVALLDSLQRSADQAGVKLLTIEYKPDAARSSQASSGPNAKIQQVAGSIQAGLPESAPTASPSVTSFKPNQKGIQVLALAISAQGGYDQLRNFLWLVERSSRIIMIQNCSLQAEPKQSTTTASSALAGSSSLKSLDPPPPAPEAKGSRNAELDKEAAGTNEATATAANEKARDRFDLHKMKMNLQINTFYSQ